MKIAQKTETGSGRFAGFTLLSNVTFSLTYLLLYKLKNGYAFHIVVKRHL